MTDIGIRDISVSFRDNKISNISLVQGDALTRGFDITFINAKGETLPVDDDYVVELVAVNSKDKDKPYACKHEIVDDKYRVMIPPEALSKSGSVTIQLVFYQKSTKAVIHTIKQKCPVYQSIGQEFVESNNLYIDITALRLGLERIEVMETAYLQVLEDEETRKSSENTRIANEQTRVEAETQRVDNEAIRNSNEIKRENNEDIRIDNENKRVSAEADRTVVFDEMTESLEDYKTPLATDTVAGKVKVDKMPTETGEITVPSVGKLKEEIKRYTAQFDGTDTPGGKISIGEETKKDAFFGEVSSDELISGEDLALKVGLTTGNSVNNDVGWLKFMYKGKVQFVAKKNIRMAISWTNLISSGLVYGDKTVEIKGLKYKVRIPRAISEDILPDAKEKKKDIKPSDYHFSEWNTLFGHISEQAPSSWAYPARVNSPIPRLQRYYTSDELDFTTNCSVCQEIIINYQGEDRSVNKGLKDMSGEWLAVPTTPMGVFGWRPVLELVE